MEPLENYPLVHRLLEAIGLSVFHTLWAGCLLLLLLAVVLKAIPTQQANARFTTSLLTLQLLFLLFLGIFFYRWNQATPVPHPVARTITAPMPTPTTIAPSAPTTAEVNFPSDEVAWLARLNQWSPWLATLWLLGGLFHVARLGGGLQHTRRLRAKTQPLSNNWKNRFAKLKQRLGIQRPVLFRESGQITVPLTFGCLKPVVLIPAGLLTQLSPEQVEMIVLHELAHIRRHDYLWSLSQSVAEVVLFYHPAYWFIARVLEREREFVCDQMTVSATQQPEVYARTLLQVASTTTSAYGLAVSGRRGLSARIKRIVAPTGGQRGISVLPVLVLIGVLGLASMAYAWQSLPLSDTSQAPSANRQSTFNQAPIEKANVGKMHEPLERKLPINTQTADTSSVTICSPARSSVKAKENEPLFVIDGIIQSKEENQLDQLDPENIKRISVLKGAAATTAYGDQAAHGVVLVTTYRGPKTDTTQTSPTDSFKEQSSAKGQDSVLLTGQVHNWFTNEHVPDVQVVADGLKTTVTNADGRYQFRFPSSTEAVSLTFTAPGYPTREMSVDLTGKKHFHAVINLVQEDESLKIEALQTQSTQDSVEELLHVFPNPTQDWFTLRFSIGEALPITITVLDAQGKLLTTLTDQTYPAGAHEVGWDASDRKPGVYFVRWTIGNQRVTRKVVIE